MRNGHQNTFENLLKTWKSVKNYGALILERKNIQTGKSIIWDSFYPDGICEL
jgi:hypothetical protein